MELDPRRLKFLLAVARAGGVLAAADELHLTASAVSQQIARLERESGYVLLTRTSVGSVLTAEGVALAEAAQEIEQTLSAVRSRLEQDDAHLQGVMRLGGFQSFLSVIVAPALPEWRRRLPGVQFEIVELDTDPLLRALKVGDLDAAVFELDAGESDKPLPAGMVDIPLLDDPWKLVVPAGTLVSDITDLGRLRVPWLGVDPTAASAHATARLQRISGTDEVTAHRFWGMQTAIALIASGEGMALMPALALRGIPHEGVDLVDVPGLGARRIVLRSHPRSKRSKNMLTAVTALIREAVASLDAFDEDAAPPVS